MKTHTTNNFLKNYDIQLKCGYCALQSLLSYENARYYNAGIYGWNFDTYTFYIDTNNGIKRVALSTGYRNMKGILVDHDLCEKYEKKAQEIKQTYKYDEIQPTLKRLITQLINETIKQ